jgi:hypothetical protein
MSDSARWVLLRYLKVPRAFEGTKEVGGGGGDERLFLAVVNILQLWCTLIGCYIEFVTWCRELRRLKEEEGGSYQCGSLLSQRYLLQRLLGKGGFSEVYQAFSLPVLKNPTNDSHSIFTAMADTECFGNVLVW